MNKPGLSARITIIMLSLGLVAMLAASLKYRLEDHPLITNIAPQTPRQAAPVENGDPEQALDAMAEVMQNDPEQASMIALMLRMQMNPNDPDTLLDLRERSGTRGKFYQPRRGSRAVRRPPALLSRRAQGTAGQVRGSGGLAGTFPVHAG